VFLEHEFVGKVDVTIYRCNHNRFQVNIKFDSFIQSYKYNNLGARLGFAAADGAPSAKNRRGEMINKDLLEILACPQCKGPLQLQGEDGLLCEKCSLLYEIRDDIPIMLIDKAKKIQL
jgi:uncharacterized protein